MWLKELRVSNKNAISGLNTLLGDENLSAVRGAKSAHIHFFTHKNTEICVVMELVDEITRILELNESEVNFTTDTSAKYYKSLTRISIIASGLK